MQPEHGSKVKKSAALCGSSRCLHQAQTLCIASSFATHRPSLEDFTQVLARFQKRGSTMRIKALLLDQAFAAGVGNWVADEILYQARALVQDTF